MRYEFRNEEVFIITTQERCKTYTDRRKTYTDTIYREGVRMTTETKFMETETNKEISLVNTEHKDKMEGSVFKIIEEESIEIGENITWFDDYPNKFYIDFLNPDWDVGDCLEVRNEDGVSKIIKIEENETIRVRMDWKTWDSLYQGVVKSYKESKEFRDLTEKKETD